MRSVQNESRRLAASRAVVIRRFAHFGPNKTREIIRLVYEISKREDVAVSDVLAAVTLIDFEAVKKTLLIRRFPHESAEVAAAASYLPEVLFDKKNICPPSARVFYPKHVYVQRIVAGSALVARLKNLFPRSRFEEIASFKEYERAHRGVAAAEYNQRRDRLFVVSQQYDFFKACPCTGGARGCGYKILNVGFGCVYDCAYCFLQGYTNSPGIMIPANLAQFFDALLKQGPLRGRMGTGEFTDSLALDHITEFSIPLVEFFRKNRLVAFEFKTKSTRIDNLLRIRSAKNIVISWSLNPPRMVRENECGAASLQARLRAAARCAEAGYRVGFHFDPMVYYSGWQKEYLSVVEQIFAHVRPRDVAWISLGTFRLQPQMKPVIEARFPHNTMLDEEMLMGFDGKLRYLPDVRRQMYGVMIAALRKVSPSLHVYLCMEDALMHKAVGCRSISQK